MKVILLRDVAKIGRRFEVVNIPDGYALNSLIPKKDAEPATPANLKRIEKQKTKTASNREADLADFKIKAEKLCAKPLEIPAEINEIGHLFQSIHASDIVMAAKNCDITLSENTIVIDKPIKEAGEHSVTLKLHDTTYKLPIVVVNNK
ncbi:MAG: 50S ribosomal protein L9 [Candidatus Paceibacterota bacterium]